MIAPILTEQFFQVLLDKGLTSFKNVGALNSKNCKENFSKTIPKALRDTGCNAFLIIKNHRGRWKYLGFEVEEKAGSLRIIDNPEVVWSGYVLHNNVWYAVPSEDLVRGVIKNNCRIILPEIETLPEVSEDE